MESKTDNIETLEVFQISQELGDLIWDEVSLWEYFEKKTIGTQFARAADSIAANIAEGYGRYFYRETLQFLYYARGSLYETKYWFSVSKNRRILKNIEIEIIEGLFKELFAKLNGYINFVRSKSKK